MKKLTLIGLLLCGTLLTGWQLRQAFNRPKSVVVNAATTNIPTAFSDAAGSLVMQGLSGGYYQNLMVINETNSPVSILTLPEVSTAPAATVTGERLHCVSFGATAFDNVSLFDNLYIQSEDNTVNSKKVKITVW